MNSQKRPHRCLACGGAMRLEHLPHIERLLDMAMRMSPDEVERMIRAERARRINHVERLLRADGSMPEAMISKTINECIERRG